MVKLAIMYTTTATAEALNALAAEILPDSRVVNFVGDSTLSQLASNGVSVAESVGRILQYTRLERG